MDGIKISDNKNIRFFEYVRLVVIKNFYIHVKLHIFMFKLNVPFFRKVHRFREL